MKLNAIAKLKVPPNVKSLLFKAAEFWNKNGPEICNGLGIACSVGSTVAAIKATMEIEPVLDEAKERIDAVRNQYKGREDTTEYKKKLALAYCVSVRNVAKKYGFTMALEVASCLFNNHSRVMLRDQNGALAVAYMAVNEELKTIKNRIKNSCDKEQSMELIHGVKETEYVEQSEDGEEKVIKELEYSDEPHPEIGPFARIFDSRNVNWVDDADTNLNWLRAKEDEWNWIGACSGLIDANEFYKDIGYKQTIRACNAGLRWNPDGGPHQFDMGLYDFYNGATDPHPDPKNACILINPNFTDDVLGNFYSMYGMKKARAMLPGAE